MGITLIYLRAGGVPHLWKAFNKGYNFNLTSIRGLNKKLWASKVTGIPIREFWDSQFGSFGTKWHLGVGPVARHWKYYKGEGGGFPQVWAMVSLVNPCLPVALFVHQECYNYALTNLLFGLCKSMWIIDLLVICSSYHPGASTCPSSSKVLQAKVHTPTPYPFAVFTFGLIVESIKEFGGALGVVYCINYIRAKGWRLPFQTWTSHIC